MGKQNTRILMQYAALVIVLTVAIMVKEAASIVICNIDTNDLQKCRAAASGNNPPPPGRACCAVIRSARTSLQCLCSYKGFLPGFGINPSKVRPLIAKCGVRSPSCL